MDEREHLHTLPARIVSGVAVALLGAAVGWGANALTLVGRVDAVERGLQRIESQLERVLSQRGAGLPVPAPPQAHNVGLACLAGPPAPEPAMGPGLSATR